MKSSRKEMDPLRGGFRRLALINSLIPTPTAMQNTAELGLNLRRSKTDQTGVGRKIGILQRRIHRPRKQVTLWIADVRAIRSIGRNGLGAAVRSVAASFPSEAAASRKDGPKPTLAMTCQCCGAASRSGLSCVAQHFGGSNAGVRTKCAFAAVARKSALHQRISPMTGQV